METDLFSFVAKLRLENVLYRTQQFVEFMLVYWHTSQWTTHPTGYYFTHHDAKLAHHLSIVFIEMSKELQYMHAEELASKLSQKSVSERESDRADEIVILDVRSEDEYVEDGHIRGAVNLPSTRWYEGGFVDRLVREHMDAHSTGKTIVLHCAYSQQRGPTCARLLLDGFDRSVASSAIDAATVPQM